MSLSLNVYGHRGSRRHRPDNTIESFRHALEQGADGFEADVRRLTDGSIALFNADFVEGRPTATFTFDELAAEVPDLARLSDLSAISSGEMILEIKAGGFEAQLVDEIQRLPRVVLCSFDHRVIASLARIRDRSGAPFGLGVTVTARLIDGASYVSAIGADWFFPASSFVDEETVVSFTERGIKVVPWVMNHQMQWHAAFDWGCHGIITDTPLEAARWVASSGSSDA